MQESVIAVSVLADPGDGSLNHSLPVFFVKISKASSRQDGVIIVVGQFYDPHMSKRRTLLDFLWCIRFYNYLGLFKEVLHDYRELNCKTHPDRQPIPRVQDVMDGLGVNTMFRYYFKEKPTTRGSWQRAASICQRS